MPHYTVNQHPRQACKQCDHSGRTQGWLGVERCQLDIGEQQWVTGFHCVCEVLQEMVDSVPRWQLSLSWPIQSDHLSIADWMLHHVTTFWAGTFSWQDPVHSWKAGPDEVMTVENLFIYY